MPIFEFRCDQCGDEFERFVLMSEKDGEKCPKCGSENTRKIMSVFSSGGIERSLESSCGSSSSGFS
jgi:putative FmdB family regulatory protein